MPCRLILEQVRPGQANLVLEDKQMLGTRKAVAYYLHAALRAYAVGSVIQGRMLTASHEHPVIYLTCNGTFEACQTALLPDGTELRLSKKDGYVPPCRPDVYSPARKGIT